MKKRVLMVLIILFSFSLTGCHTLAHLEQAHYVLNKGPMTTKIYREKTFHNINVDCLNEDIQFKNADHYRVIYKGGKNLMPTVTMKNDTLTIKNKNVVHFTNRTQAVIIEMPKEYLNSAKIYTANGDIYGSTIKMNSGNITSDNGDIDLDALYLKGKVKVDSNNGDITIDNCNAKGYQLSSDNGDIYFDGDDEDDSFKRNTSSRQLLSAYSDNGDVSVN
jgi:DUF4097 and DUF4098 domain-containing protein YvlB